MKNMVGSGGGGVEGKALYFCEGDGGGVCGGEAVFHFSIQWAFGFCEHV